MGLGSRSIHDRCCKLIHFTYFLDLNYRLILGAIFFYPFIYIQYQEDIPIQSTNQPRCFSIPPSGVSCRSPVSPSSPTPRRRLQWMDVDSLRQNCFWTFFFGGEGGQIRKKTTTWYPKQPSFNGLVTIFYAMIWNHPIGTTIKKLIVWSSRQKFTKQCNKATSKHTERKNTKTTNREMKRMD